MEAHAGTITIGTGRPARSRRRHLAELRKTIRRRRLEHAERVHSLRANSAEVRSLPGSDHSHLVRRPRGF